MFVRKIATPGLFLVTRIWRKSLLAQEGGLCISWTWSISSMFFQIFSKNIFGNPLLAREDGFCISRTPKYFQRPSVCAPRWRNLLFCFSLLKASLETFILLHKPRRWSNFHAFSRFSFNVNE